MTEAKEYPFDTDILKQLIIDIHQDNVDMGWWELPRDIHTFACLFNSELAEATEGIRKNLMDDKLPHYENAPVEMADFIIRLMDYLGYVYKDDLDALEARIDLGVRLLGAPKDSDSLSTQFIMGFYNSISEFVTSTDKDHASSILLVSIIRCLKGLHDFGYPIMEIIQAKRDFNKGRADHKLENRLNGERGSKTF